MKLAEIYSTLPDVTYAPPVFRWLMVFAFVGCATGPDSRPATTDYIIEAILVPYCGRGGCHSTNTAARNLIFDTIADSRIAMSKSDRGKKLVVPGQPEQSELWELLFTNRLETIAFGSGGPTSGYTLLQIHYRL